MKNCSSRLHQLFLFCILLLLGAVNGKAQIITTIAGTPTSMGYTGDGGPATAATCGRPCGLHLDKKGNLYIGFPNNLRLRMVDSTGIIDYIAGTGAMGAVGDGGPATAATVDPFDVFTDKNGNIYIADGNRLRKIDTAHIIHTVAGNGSTGYSGDGGPATAASTSPSSAAIDTLGNLYLADGACVCIRKVDISGIITTIAGNGTSGYSGDGGPATAALLSGPAGIKTDKQGNIFIADVNSAVIRKINSSGIISTIAGIGTSGFSGDGGPATAAKFNGPQGLAVDDIGNIFIADFSNNRVRKVDRAGIITKIAGSGGAVSFSGDGGPATAARMHNPLGVTLDGWGNMYISDYGNYCIRYVGFNKKPLFVGGHVLEIGACMNTPASLNTTLAALETDSTQRVTWSAVTSPLHGTCSVAYSAISLGAPLVPSGLSYTPYAGYVGADTFMVRVTDGQLSDTAAVYVTVTNLMPYAGAISGTDSVCIGDTIRLSDTTTGGAWSSSNAALATVSTTGLVKGVANGSVNIRYIVTNPCGADTAFHPVYVRRWADCPNSIASTTTATKKVSIYPNPNTNLLRINAAIDVRLVLCFLDGKTAMEFNHVKEADISALASGVYLAMVYDMQGNRLLVEKVIKQ